MGIISNFLWISCYKNAHQQQKWASLATNYGLVAIKRDYQQQKWASLATIYGLVAIKRDYQQQKWASLATFYGLVAMKCSIINITIGEKNGYE